MADKPIRWPFAPLLQNRADNFNTDARIINGYTEKDQDGGFYRIRKRPCVGATRFTPGGAGAGLYYWSRKPYGFGDLVIDIGQSGSNLAVYNGSTFLGNMANGAGAFNVISFCPVPATVTPLLLMHNGGGLLYSTDGATVTHITGGFPSSTVPGIAYLDQTFYVMDALGKIWGSNLNDPTTWNPLNNVIAQAEPNGGVYLAKQLTYVVAFLEWTIQVFFDNSNPAPGSPLNELPGAVIPYGCLNYATVAELDGDLFFVASNKHGTPVVGRLSNLQLSLISSPGVERLLALSQPYDNWRSTAIRMAGHSWYVVSNLQRNFTLVYDIGEQLWYIWTDGGVGNSPNAWPWFSFIVNNNSGLGNTEYQVQNVTNGNVVDIAPDYDQPTDNNVIVQTDIYSPNADFQVNRRKTLNKMYFSGDQVQGSILQVRHSDDDYRSFSEFRTVDMNLRRPFLDNCGTFERRALHIRHTCATPMRLSTVDLDMDLGAL